MLISNRFLSAAVTGALLASIVVGSSADARVVTAKKLSKKEQRESKVDPADFAKLQAAIFHRKGKQGGVVPFMEQMAKDGKVKTDKGTISFARFKEIWTDSKNDSMWVEREFRAADPNKHEWIPSNYILPVVERAARTREGEKWIKLQDEMRSTTNLLLFKPSRWDVVEKGGKSYYVPQGHSGALFDKKSGFALTEHQAEFHDELRAVFDKTKTITDTVAGMKKLAAKWIWSGEPLKYPIAPNVVNHEKKPLGTPQQAQKVQKNNYDAVMDMFDTILKRVTAPAKAAADKAA